MDKIMCIKCTRIGDQSTINNTLFSEFKDSINNNVIHVCNICLKNYLEQYEDTIIDMLGSRLQRSKRSYDLKRDREDYRVEPQ